MYNAKIEPVKEQQKQTTQKVFNCWTAILPEEAIP